MIKYTITPDAARHAYYVELELSDFCPEIVFKMANWTSGSYIIRDFAQHVFDVKVKNGTVSQIEKNIWKVTHPNPEEPFVLSWSVFANANRVHELFIDTDYGFINPPALLLFQEGMQDLPAEIAFKTDYAVHTSLVPETFTLSESFSAPTLEELLDTPFSLTSPNALAQVVDFSVAGVPHRFLFTGAATLNLERIANDTKAMCEKTVELWQFAPFQHYLFHCHVGHGLYNGLEHQNCSILQFDSDDLPGAGEETPPKKYSEFLELVAHEYFHAWLVKFLRPANYLPNYPFCGTEAYTEMLWVFEGFTSYYEQRIPYLAGIMTEEEFLESLSKRFSGVTGREGFKKEALTDASRLAWIHLYKQSANSPYQHTSYYGKGAIVAFFLDALIRQNSDGSKSLDTLLRDWCVKSTLNRDDRGLAEGGFSALCKRLGYEEVSDLVEKLTRTHDEFLWQNQWRATCDAFGLKVEEKKKSDLLSYWGLSMKEGTTTVAYTPTQGAAFRAGLFAGDEIVAIDGVRVTAARLERQVMQRLFAKQPIEVTFFRRDLLHRAQVVADGIARFEQPVLVRCTELSPAEGCENWLLHSSEKRKGAIQS